MRDGIKQFIPLIILVVLVLALGAILHLPKAEPATFNAPDIAAITSDIVQDVVTVNPYSEQTKTYTEVRQLRIRSRTSIAVRVAFDDATTADSYFVLPSGQELPLANLYLGTVTLKLKGDTASDTGNVAIIIGK